MPLLSQVVASVPLFEARGYSAWDPTSPVFVVGDTLMIPTVFVSYTGEALDYKVPLKKALAAVDKAATAVCHYFYPDVTKVTANLGWEQEYFLIDEDLFAARPDLVLTGRTLMGHDSAKTSRWTTIILALFLNVWPLLCVTLRFRHLNWESLQDPS